MLRIAFHNTSPEVEDYWSYLGTAFAVDCLYSVGKTDRLSRNMVGLAKLRHLPADGASIVVVQPENGRYVQGDVPLIEFEHPESCVYLFGSDCALLAEKDLEGLDVKAKVYIPQAEMHSPVVGGIVLWDRFLKRGGLG